MATWKTATTQHPPALLTRRSVHRFETPVPDIFATFLAAQGFAEARSTDKLRIFRKDFDTIGLDPESGLVLGITEETALFLSSITAWTGGQL